MPSGSRKAPLSPDDESQPELPLFDAALPLAKSSSPASNISRIFPGWERPVLDLVVERLVTGWDESPVLDLSDHLIIVPTRNAGRLLREKLALRASLSDATVIPPLVGSPEFLLSPDRLEACSEDQPIATAWISLLFWSSFLLDLPLDQYRHIFPIDPAERDLKWAMGSARELWRIRKLLSDGDHDFTTACQILSAENREPQRWRELARLENEMVSRIEKQGYQDEYRARSASAENGKLPPGIKRILVAAVPDISRQLIRALRRHHCSLPVEILIHAPSDLADYFDSWGRPNHEFWINRQIDIPCAEHAIHQAVNPKEQASLVSRLLRQYESNPAGISCIGIPDSEVAAPLAEVLAAKNWTVHDPTGQPISYHGIYYLLQQTGNLLAERSFAAFQRLLRCPDFHRALRSSLSESDGSGISLLKQFDRLAERCLPYRIEDARSAAKRCFPKRPELLRALDWAIRWMERFHREPFEDVLLEYLSTVFADRIFQKNDQARSGFNEVASAIHDALDDLQEVDAMFRIRLGSAEKLELLLEILGDCRIYPERNARDIDLQGWLELPWDDAPHLIITGFNDHLIPESITGHSFLPDSARRLLDIPSNDSRMARDAFLLTGLIESRAHSGGRVDLIFGRQSNGGDPLRPSRLLFQCSDKELPHRILRFFNAESLEQQPHPWKLPWKLQPFPLPDEHRIFHQFSVTSFKNYLACPFRFYLAYGLGMKDLDVAKTEMDSREFGSLIHGVLEDFGNDRHISQSVNEKEIAEFFHAALDKRLTAIYGTPLSTPLLIQRESARNRLGWWAQLEARQRRAGWIINDIEHPIGNDQSPFCIGNTPIHGRIDRIERHEELGYRVIDFKTGSLKNKPVSSFHQRFVKKTESPDQFPEWSLVTDKNGKQCRWTDLQIPLYVTAMKQEHPGQTIGAGYGNIGPTRAEIRISLWEELDDETLTSANSCAEHIVEAIRKEHRFWPPSDQVAFDDYQEILFGNPTAAVSGESGF